MGVSIEFGLNPYWRQNSVVVTGSRSKRRLYEGVGIPVERDSNKIAHVGNGEQKYDQRNRNGVVVRREKIDAPYPVLVARAKAEELAPRFKPNGHFHVVSDSTYEIMGPDGLVFSLNKTSGERRKETEIIKALYGLRGRRISSDTGLAVLPSDVNLQEMELYHASLMMGMINPTLDMGQVEQLITNNPDTAGGFSVLDAIQYGLVIPDPTMHFRTRRIIPTGAPFVSGRVMRYEAVVHEMSTDSSNNEWMKRLAVGVIPRK
ncbi:MAG: hypothetical protein V1922_03090 [bacterium]